VLCLIGSIPTLMVSHSLSAVDTRNYASNVGHYRGQSYCLLSILFLFYMADLLRWIENYGLYPHLYSNDTLIYGSCRSNASAERQCRLFESVSDVA